MTHPIVIIGTGLAGYNTAREFRKLDKETPVLVIAADHGHYYSKPMISNALASGKTAETLPIKNAEQMAKEISGQVRTLTRVSRILPARHQVMVGDEIIDYSKLVLALGASQIRIDLEGDAADQVLSVNDLIDYGSFRAAIAGKKNVVIFGAGLIGCEFANDLVASGHVVDVIDIAPQPLGRLLTAEGGAIMQRKLADAGVRWHLNTSAKSVERDAERLKVTLKDGKVLTADVVLSAIGLKPNIALAQQAGLATARGIVVNRRLQTSDPDVYALGDCVEVEQLVLPFIMPIMHAARVCAANLAGKEARLSYPAMPVIVKTPACPTVVSPPAAGAKGEWQVTVTADGVKACFVDETGKLLGFALNGTAMTEKIALTAQLPPVMS